MKRTAARDETVKAAFDRFHQSAKTPAADKQLRRDLRQAGVKPEFKEEGR